MSPLGLASRWGRLRAAVRAWLRSPLRASSRRARFAGAGTRHDETLARRLGRRGEQLAAAHLRQRGYRVVARNLVLGSAEADLVCLTPDRSTLVVVEVKARTLEGQAGPSERTPEAAITERKQRKLRQLARSLTAMREWAGRAVRIDVVAVDLPAFGKPVIRHHADAVR